MSAELSEYEKQRLQNIRRNQEVLHALGLDQRVLPISGARAGGPPVKRRRPDPKPPSAPERRSSRLEGAKAPDFYIASESAKGEITVGGDEKALAKVGAVL